MNIHGKQKNILMKYIININKVNLSSQKILKM